MCPKPPSAFHPSPTQNCPGLNPRRILRLVREAIHRCNLDLRGKTVLTEAATLAYVVTPIIAAMAGAQRVCCVTHSTRHGSVSEVMEQTLALAELAGIRERVQIHETKTAPLVGAADIVTNSGHLRPLDALTIDWMKPTAVIALMYEAWEARAQDVDLAACRRRGIPVVGVNETHPEVEVFGYLPVMAAKMLAEAGVAIHRSRILLLCDNAFGPYLQSGLTHLGAEVALCATPAQTLDVPSMDALLLALNPGAHPPLSSEFLEEFFVGNPATVLCQFWGDIDPNGRRATEDRVWPRQPPAAGHMGILLSDLGVEPVIRLQTGGLKAAAVVHDQRPRDADATGAPDREMTAIYQLLV